MTTIDAKFRAQYRQLYSDGSISAADAKALTAAAAGNADRKDFLREKLASDSFESTASRQVVERAVRGDGAAQEREWTNRGLSGVTE